MNKVKKLLIIFSILLSVILLPVSTYALENNNEINKLSQDNTNKIEKFVKKQISKGKLPGVSVVVVNGNKTIYQKGYGYADLASKQEVTSKTLFELGSTTKAFTALGILDLQKKGLIKLDDKVNKYFPWFKVYYKGKEVPITIEQLLHHTSGIPFKSIDKIPFSNSENSLEKTVKTLIGTELDRKPGEKFEYATINYDVLGLIIEKVSGVKYETYIEENVLKPMGLTNTYMYRNKVVRENIAKGYKLGFLRPKVYDAPAYTGNKPAGYIITDAVDMAKWLEIQMNTLNSSKFSRDLIELSHNPDRRVPPSDDGSSYADGWFVYQKGGGEIEHDGSNPNYSSFIIFRPEDKIGIAVLCNTNSDYTAAIGRGINEILQGKDYNKEIKDLGKIADTICTIIIVMSILIILVTLYLIIKALKEIFKKERKLNKKFGRCFVNILISLAFMLGIGYCVYLIPYILYEGVSWQFVFVWLPETVKFALSLFYISLLVIYLYYLIISIFKREYDRSVLILCILSAVSGFGNALIIFTVNMAIGSSNSYRVKILVYFVLGIILYVCGQKIVRTKLIDLTNKLIYSKRIQIIKCILRFSYSNFEQIGKGKIESTLNNDTETLSRFVNILISGVTAAITLVFCFIYLAFINKYALLFSIVIIVLIASVYYIVGIYANKVGEESRDLQNVFFKFISDLIGGFKELNLNEKRKSEFQDDMEKTCDKYRIKRGKSALAFANMFVIGELLFTLAIGAVALILPLMLKNLEESSIASYVFILLYMTGPVNIILDAIPSTVDIRISLKRINNLIGEISNFEHEEKVIQERITEKIDIKLNEVEYEYKENEEKVFKVGPITYEFKSGEIVFITGGNGSGKSTLGKLLTGLYTPSNGYITLNNSRVSENTLKEKYSTVFADFYLFDKLYGIDYKEKEKEIIKHLQILQLNNKVQIIDGSFSTTKLSTGQKKRLALLVAYLEDRPIYLFDEWAADQDPEFRKFFYNILLPELKERGKCVIAVTHDDNYFHMADKIIKMDMGKFK
ncbi:cyclic peptide export ABC transporter [Clostridium felsineum]|uniref:cyclic peptide export ABC transporter n=1 Tax=Clostridium felsineum TaxID=36839 RepID=UPI00098C64CA|nr:cyclic peptide export ABC transporter [Clostridium felsineum]MCR3759002.1 cyclic peptide export ABC transporter [Clostridium felsineum]URZ00309.1 Putative D-alanyl-D-alanine carboxypeptidase [Clostridium felsineum]